MILLDATTKSLELVTSATTNVDYLTSYADNTTSAFTPGSSDGQITTATTTTIVAAPASSTQRTIKLINVHNTSTTTGNNVTLQYDVSGTNRTISPTFTLGPGESLRYTQESGFRVYTSSGAIKHLTPSKLISGQTLQVIKSITAPEASGTYYSAWKDAGAPGVWATGSPGVGGRATDGTNTANDAGCLGLIQPATGNKLYISDVSIASSVITTLCLYDVLWVNTGLTVTTTTSQTVTSATLPARDINGSTNGEGVRIGMVFTAASTNAGTISGATISYTNQAGTSGRTATLSASPYLIPATPVIGTMVPFLLAAGDTGVRSIQSITLGTSLVTGSISLIMYVPLFEFSVAVANASAQYTGLSIPVQPKACILPFYLASATSTLVSSATIAISERSI
jgi:hypothetical protein